ncbi:MAG: ankyrin repeat domain-containing protein [Sedimentisphaerales bacterium]|nr:ankyrin repeat domain-containing protein [Sedimentisphaerales bacterium]
MNNLVIRISVLILMSLALISVASISLAAAEKPAEPTAIDESLHQAIIAGDAKKFESLISSGAGINSRNRQSWTPLHTAIWYGSKETVELVLSKGADVNAPENQGHTPLHFAAIRGDSNSVDLLLAKGANINVKTSAGQTPLYLAAEAGHKNVVEQLIAKGADINAQAGSDNALSIAQKKGNNELVELLLKHGAKEPSVDSTAGRPYGLEGQKERLSSPPSGALNPYQNDEGQKQAANGSAASTQESGPGGGNDTIGDPNEIKARVKTYEGLEKALTETDSKARNEKGSWLSMVKSDNRTSIARVLEEQVKEELTFVRNIAAEEKAEKTTKVIDDVLSSRQQLYDKTRKELLAQRKEQQETQRLTGRGQTRGSRSTRGQNTQGGQTGQDMSGPYGGRAGVTSRSSGLRGEPNEGPPADTEAESKINQWLQTTSDNSKTLLQSVYSEVRTQYISIRAVASEEGAKKTAAAIDGLLLKRQERIDNLLMRMEKESQQTQEVRGRGTGRAARGGQQSQWGQQPGQEQNMEQSPARSRRR